MSETDGSPAATADVDWLLLSSDSRPAELERFNDANARLGLPVELMPITEGHEVDLRELAQIDLIDPQGIDWSANDVGRALSHWLCWHQAIESGRATCVLETDAILRGDVVERLRGLLQSLPPDWDIAQLGYDTRGGIDFRVTPDCRFVGQFTRPVAFEHEVTAFTSMRAPVVPLRLFTAFGRFAYLVSPAGAQKLVDLCFPLTTRAIMVPALNGRVRTTNIDFVMNQYFGTLESYVCFPPLALQRDSGV